MNQFFKVQFFLILLPVLTHQLGDQSPDTCGNVNTHLTALTEAFNSLCVGNTLSSSSRSCTCPVEWESFDMVRIGTINMNSTDIQSFDIPAAVPETACEVLVYVYVIKGTATEYSSNMKIYTESNMNR